MPTHVTYQIIDEDSISFFYSDPVVAGVAHRDDFAILAKEDEVKKPGIYILISPSKRYVGQASSSILTRLQEHYKNKDWWEEVIFISHQWGGLGKDKLDYLESKLITEFKALGYDMDNSNGGNTSHIGRGAKIEADNFIQGGIESIEQIGKIKFYPKPRKLKDSVFVLPIEPIVEDRPIFGGVLPIDPSLDTNVIGSPSETVSDGPQLTLLKPRTSRRPAYKAAVYDDTGIVSEEVSTNSAYAEYLREFVKTTPNGYQSLSAFAATNPSVITKADSSPNGKRYTSIVQDLWLNTNISRDTRVANVRLIGKHIGREITIEEWVKGAQDTGKVTEPFVNPTAETIKEFFRD